MILNAAKHINTNLEWSDLVLDNHTLKKVMELNSLLYKWSSKSEKKLGFRTLFYGPSGSGKTLTTTLLGKDAGLDVYRINLSLVVSKYIGETENNLANIFDQAEDKHWLLYFDEADALFGKRTQISDSHYRYANQEIAYLLQRIENFSGVVIVSTNLKSNLDKAFLRRFKSIIQFPMPDSLERLRLWQNFFVDKNKFADDINLEVIAQKYELTGGAIINIARFCTLNALKDGRKIMLDDIMAGLRRELSIV